MKEYMTNFNEEKLREAFNIKEAYKNGEITLEFANAQMKAHVGSLTPAELAYIEQEMQEPIDDECAKEDIAEMLAIYEGVLIEEPEKADLLPGHPIRNYREENQAIRALIKEMDVMLSKEYIKNQWDEAFEKLNEFKTHLSRKQNQLYTALERKGFDRPTETMWLYDNEIRDKITSVTEMAKSDDDREHTPAAFENFKEYILDLMEKEDTILYPTSLELIGEDEFREMVSGDKEIGYCLITPSDEYEKSSQNSGTGNASQVGNGGSELSGFKDELAGLLSKYGIESGWTPDTPMEVKQGILSLNQINLLFQHLPVDISYVDENELVAFYSDTKHRVFPRSKGVIGRDVKNCHPKNSVETVEEIIEKFRSGEKDRVEFWINKPGLFIYILYVAVRDANGKFKGVMEMMQDCTHIRDLQGSQTLLDWDAENSNKNNEENSQQVDTSKEETEDMKETAKGDKITVLKPEMKIAPIFDQYPTLKDYMISKSDKFKMMNSPMFKFMKRVATVKDVSERSGYSIETLQKEFTKFIETLK